ncbi:siderophore-interacting protein [Actinoplanes sp. LDG1-06]|uniref:Siderophore-interacting protein n=1 Tax=Paractinoplanes ovalisporus TaxID=2810368 RepID=A0ABS2AHT3_9ACTN|nr:siderophore-interacting protein [Actinoplanes ovalisporus]MBM2619389.1 siderophore-interacting protein [Actinoplanes ovalisporus]
MSRLADRLADLAATAMFRATTVTEVSRLSPAFTRVRLTDEAFRKQVWTPGAKLQIRPRRGSFSFRTYTPVSWDEAQGAVELIAYLHGDGPASQWFKRVAVGDTCEVFGPRASIDLPGVTGPVVFAGDESSVALACALRTLTDDVSYVFESDDPAGLDEILAGLNLAERATSVARTADRAALLGHLREAASGGPYTLVVTGDAATVHAVRRDSRTWASGPRQIKGKAYWAEGRAGLD